VAGTNGYNTKFNIFRTTLASLDSDPKYRGSTFPVPDPAMLIGQGVPVPNMVGSSSLEAHGALTSQGLRFVDGGAVVSGLPGGQVVTTSPAAGTLLSKGATVTVYTSDGSLAISMPDEVGKARSAAVDDLVSHGFSRGQIGFVWRSSNNHACRVVSSDPKPGSATGVGSPVTLTILSGGPQSGSAPPATGCP